MTQKNEQTAAARLQVLRIRRQIRRRILSPAKQKGGAIGDGGGTAEQHVYVVTVRRCLGQCDQAGIEVGACGRSAAAKNTKLHSHLPYRAR